MTASLLGAVSPAVLAISVDGIEQPVGIAFHQPLTTQLGQRFVHATGGQPPRNKRPGKLIRSEGRDLGERSDHRGYLELIREVRHKSTRKIFAAERRATSIQENQGTAAREPLQPRIVFEVFAGDRIVTDRSAEARERQKKVEERDRLLTAIKAEKARARALRHLAGRLVSRGATALVHLGGMSCGFATWPKGTAQARASMQAACRAPRWKGLFWVLVQRVWSNHQLSNTHTHPENGSS